MGGAPTDAAAAAPGAAATATATMMFTVTMTHSTRPTLTQLALEALEVALGRSQHEWRVYLAVEPLHAEVVKRCREWTARNPHQRRMLVNPHRYGLNRNTMSALQWAFVDRSGFNVHVEDDIVLAVDALDYFAWAAEDAHGAWGHTRAIKNVATVTAYHRAAYAPATAYGAHEARTRQWFHPWAWGTWSDRWPAIREVLHRTIHDPGLNHLGWDVALNGKFQHAGWYEMYPALARGQNIGAVSSVRGESSAHHKLELWADRELPPGEWHMNYLAGEDEDRAVERVMVREATRGRV